jgi:hypothetical protein
LRFFHIVLIAAYFFCCYTQITESRFIYTLKDITFTQSKNNTPTRTHYFSATLQKHTHSFNQIEVGNYTNDICADIKFYNAFLELDLVPSEANLLTITLESPQNKAPPFPLV